MDEPFSNREIRELFKAADERADSFHDKLMNRMNEFEKATTGSLSRIEVQTTQHNGRMKSIELRQARAEGGLIVLSVVVIPILAWALYTLANINSVVHASVDQALSAYNIKQVP